MAGELMSSEYICASVLNGALDYYDVEPIARRTLQDLKDYIQCLNHACPVLDREFVVYIAGHATGTCYVIPGAQVRSVLCVEPA